MAPLLRRIRIKLYLLTHPFLWHKHLSLEGLFEIDCPPGLKLGHYVSIGHNCFLQCHGGITIGDYGAPDKPCGEDARMLTQNCR